ncbi:hypothetical protein [Sphingopyxis sp. A083]|jgi:hypothetical protein|uniref:hypothetical protein n=1 Tax=Sphingopyxis sp. A083 TaxID=1759083 RepID=UPI00073690CA|nr:hypothetical protein [Sphingopyxis sp. A083]KTE78581.1 hypothetical protein ATE59_01760 [Sphingopyxis sp. A083]
MNDPQNTSPGKKRARILSALFVGLFVLWQIAATEWRVYKLRAAGFGQVVVDSTRDHAYFPLAGALIGAAVFISAGAMIKRLFFKKKY